MPGFLPRKPNPKLTDMVPLSNEVTWRRQNLWADWIANCHATPGMRENETERMLAQLPVKRLQ